MNYLIQALTKKMNLAGKLLKSAGNYIENAFKVLVLIGSTWACSEGLVIIINAFSA